MDKRCRRISYYWSSRVCVWVCVSVSMLLFADLLISCIENRQQSINYCCIYLILDFPLLEELIYPNISSQEQISLHLKVRTTHVLQGPAELYTVWSFTLLKKRMYKTNIIYSNKCKKLSIHLQYLQIFKSVTQHSIQLKLSNYGKQKKQGFVRHFPTHIQRDSYKLFSNSSLNTRGETNSTF